MYGMGTVSPADCAGSFWTYATSPVSCWSKSQPGWAQEVAMEATAPPAPTPTQLQQVASGQMTAEELTQQLANQQATNMKAYSASQVAPVTDVYSAVDAVLPGGGPGGNAAACSMSMVSSVCDSTVYWGAAIVLGFLALLFVRR